MTDREKASTLRPEDLRARLRERLSALKSELERLRFETDRRWDELLARLTDKPEDIVPDELLRAMSTGSKPFERSGSIAADAARRLDSATTQVEALARFLEECRRHASRVALLVERRGRLEIWKTSGFAAAAARPGGTVVDPVAAAVRVLEGSPERLPPGNALSASLGAGDAADAILLPFVVRERVSGAVYADVPGDGSRLDADAVALLTWVAGIVVDRLARRKLVPSPALKPLETTGEAPEAAASEAAPLFASIPPVEQPAAPIPRDEGLPAPSPTAVPAAPERTLGGPLASPGPEEEREEARRFARLLASEIKLYNEGEVREGRARGDLYARLRDDIERGRQLYEERVRADVRSGADYYYEELVEVLADGRPEALR